MNPLHVVAAFVAVAVAAVGGPPAVAAAVASLFAALPRPPLRWGLQERQA